jgi:hypothetical protein
MHCGAEVTESSTNKQHHIERNTIEEVREKLETMFHVELD